MPDCIKAALRTAASVAFRHLDEVSVSEREQVLVALIEVLPAQEGEIAQTMLHHLREQRRLQLTLRSILEATPLPAAPTPENLGGFFGHHQGAQPASSS